MNLNLGSTFYLGRIPMLARMVPILAASLSTAQAYAGCNPKIRETTPITQFVIDAAKGTVLDKKTGLMWKQCAEGLAGVDCATGSYAGYTWDVALRLAANSAHAGYRDWRLPNLKELRSIVEEQSMDPAINVTVFPNTPHNLGEAFWSSSPVAESPDYTWHVGFVNGYPAGDGRNNAFGVRLVRGGLR